MKITGEILVVILNIYFWLLIARVILSWLKLPHSSLTYWVGKFTDPVIDFFRKKVPIRIGALDLSIIIPFICISILRRIIGDSMIFGVPLNLFYFIKLIILLVDSAYTFVAFLLFIFTVALLIININYPHINNPIVSTIKTVINPIVMYMKNIFRINSPYSERIYLLILVLLIIIAGFIGHIALINAYRIVSVAQANNLLQNPKLDTEFDFR